MVFQLFQFIFWPLDGIGSTCRKFQILSTCRRDQYGRLDTLNIKIRPIVLILALLVHILATRWRWFHLQKVLDPSIMQERSIRSFRHLQHQNPLKSKKVCPCLTKATWMLFSLVEKDKKSLGGGMVQNNLEKYVE